MEGTWSRIGCYGNNSDDDAFQYSHDGIVPMAEMGCCVSPVDADTPLGGADMVCFSSLGIYHSSAWLQEQMPELPNIVEEEFDMILRNRYGYFVIGLMAPLAEELVFRGAILRSLLKWNSRPWVAILISAILFSVAHMNPAQMPHTLLIGLLLGWMYYRTDSIVPGVVFHWVNNTVAYVLYNLYPNPDMTTSDVFGSEQLMAVAFSLCILIPALLQLNLRMQK